MTRKKNVKKKSKAPKKFASIGEELADGLYRLGLCLSRKQARIVAERIDDPAEQENALVEVRAALARQRDPVDTLVVVLEWSE